MSNRSGVKKRPPQSEPSTSSTPTHNPPDSVVSNTSPGWVGWEQASDRLQHVPAPLVSMDEDEEMGVPEHDSQTLARSEAPPDCAAQEQSKEGPTGACHQPQHVLPSSGATNESEGTVINIVQNLGQVPAIPTPSSGCAGQVQGTEDVPGVTEHLQHLPSDPTESKEIVIAAIRATDVTLGLRRLPAGFHVVLHQNGLEWRTKNKPSSVNNDVVEWSGPIPISSDLSAVICLEIYASFEFQSMLGAGEQLRRLTVTVKQLVERSGRGIPFIFFPKDGDVVSPCSSILVTVEQRRLEKNDPSGSRVVDPHWSTPEPRGELEDATNKGYSALARYRRHSEKQDLERSIQQFERALDVCLGDDPRRAAVKSNLAMAKLILSQVMGTDAPLEDALWLHRDALAARPIGHPDRPLTLIQLASVHSARLRRRRNRADEVNAEELLQEAIGLSTTDSCEERAATFTLELCARHREGRAQSEGQLSMEQDLIPSLTDQNTLNLSVWLMERFERFGNLGDLQRAITLSERLVKFISVWDRNYRAALGNLGVALWYRFERLGEISDLEEAISAQRKVVHLSPDGCLDKPMHLNNLGLPLRTRFLRLGDFSDLEEAISAHNEAVHLSPDGHPDKHTYLNNLGLCFTTRFKRLGELSDLEEGISILGEAVRLIPDGHPHKPGYLDNLGGSLQTRFLRLGELSDLEEAISRQKDAILLSSDDHPDKPGYLNHLGFSFQTRFLRLGELSDLEEAISALREAVHLTPDDYPGKPGLLNNLGIFLATRFSRLGELSGLGEAILTLRKAVHLCSDDHPHKLGYLNNLGNSFATRFSRLGELSDLEEAILIEREAVRLTPDGHPDKPTYLNNLGSSLANRFERLGELSDLDDAISRKMQAIRLVPPGHPEKSSIMNNLAESFTTRFLHLGRVTDIEHAISLSSHVASIPIGPPSVRISAAQCWIRSARLIRHPSLFHAYSVTVSLLPKLAWIGVSLSHRYDELIQSANVIREAAAAVLEAGFPQTALEWLEQGRSIVWGELFQLRSSYKELSSIHPDYASLLHSLSTQLDQASATHEQLLSSLFEQNPNGAHHTPKSLRQAADKHRSLAIERDKLLREIRRLPGFEQFLRRKPFSQLRAAAHSGPVVILNVTETRGDALIVVPNLNHVIHVPLPALTLDRSVKLQNTLKGFVRDARVGDTAPRIGISWKTILFPLWKSIVKPVLDALAFSVTPTDPSRIFWCPTGPLAFLPIHAAGSYDEQYSEPGHKVFDFVVSSYVPTLSTLLEPSNPDAPSPSGPLRLLLVPQPASDGQFKLPGVAVELQHIEDVVAKSPLACTTLRSSVGTVEEVLGLMKQTDWVHFACHGVQDGVNSGLCLADKRRLKIRDIVALSRPRGGLAFLSACQTAKGEQCLSDEAIHIAAGMLFAGYGGVVGTMWSISDMIAPDVAKKVYEELLGKGPRADYREAARALHKATGDLRAQGVPFDKWIPFIHVGL